MKIDLDRFNNFQVGYKFVIGRRIFDGEDRFYVAIKTGIKEWAVYQKPAFVGQLMHLESFLKDIVETGKIITDKKTIRELTPVTDEVFALYKYE